MIKVDTCLGYKVLQKNVALKIEKKDKNKSILIFEFNVINMLKGKAIKD
jgi:hypothetical protein